MTTRKPITLNGAQLTQLAAADTLDAGAGVVVNGFTLTAAAAGTIALRTVDNAFSAGQTVQVLNATTPALILHSAATSGDIKLYHNDGQAMLGSNLLIEEDVVNSSQWALEVYGQDRAMNGIAATTMGYANLPYPGMIANVSALTARGFNFTVDNQTINRTSFGIGIAAARTTPMIAIKNTAGPAILLENGQFEMMVMNPLNPQVTNAAALYVKANGSGTALWLRYRTTGSAWADVKIAGA